MLRPGAATAPGYAWTQRPFRRVAVIAVSLTLAACAGSSKPSTTKPTRHRSVASSSTTTTTRPFFTYQVKQGDSLTSLATFFGITLDALASVNHLSDAAALTVGQTLEVPPRQPVQLAVSPGDGPAGTSFMLSLTGAKPNETVTFQINGPTVKFTGPAHTAGPDGSVTTMYQTGTSDVAGTYTVIASGNQGTTAQATFRIDASSAAT